jgi:membrane protease YdiL (CAAX protease family)
MATALERCAELHPRRFFLDAWRDINAEARREAKPVQGIDFRPWGIMLVVCTVLILHEYLGAKSDCQRFVNFVTDPRNAELSPFWYAMLSWLAPLAEEISRPGGYWQLWQLGYWAFTRIFGYVVIPLLALPLLPGVSLRDLGLSFRGLTSHLWIYVVLFSPVLLAVVMVSFRADFSSYYPFYHRAQGLSDLLLWELLYFAQFVALEFFFRGFMLHPLRRSMGAYSICFMVVPYCMIHFGKPFLECFGAVIAGVVLGTLSLRTRSIWCGALIHISVALTMDFAALLQTGRLTRLLG